MKMTYDRIAGAMIGMAAGDLNGGPTAISRQLALSLLANNGYDHWDVLDRYFRWYKRDGKDCGPVFESVMEFMKQGQRPDDAIANTHAAFGGMTGGVAPAHRVTPIACFPVLSDGAVMLAARLDAGLTHTSEEAQIGSAALALMVRFLIRGDEWFDAKNETLRYLPRNEQVYRAIAYPTDIMGVSGHTPEALGAAMWFVASEKSFQAALSEAFSYAGPANYCPVLVGALAGARWGLSAIPEHMMDHLDSVSELERIARHYALGAS